MSEYKGIKGFQVQTRSEDPGPTEAQPGDFYYNSSTGQFKNIVSGGAPIATWASGGNLNQSRAQGGQAGSTLSAGQLSGGGAYSPGISYAQTEQYNGTSWTEVNDLNSPRSYGTGGGTQSGAIYVSGYMAPSPGPAGYRDNVETWDGSSWTEVAEVNTACYQAGGNGATSSAVMKYGGEAPGVSPSKTNGKTELWNGSSWTEANDLNTARTQLAPFGTWTSQMASSGYRGSPAGRTSDSEVWDGTSWTEVAEPNGGTIEGRMGAGVDSTSGVIFGGRAHPTYYALTEIWDGTSWTETADMATARYNGTGMGSTASALAAGGVTSPGATVATTEEFFGADFVIKTVTTS